VAVDFALLMFFSGREVETEQKLEDGQNAEQAHSAAAKHSFRDSLREHLRLMATSTTNLAKEASRARPSATMNGLDPHQPLR